MSRRSFLVAIALVLVGLSFGPLAVDAQPPKKVYVGGELGYVEGQSLAFGWVVNHRERIVTLATRNRLPVMYTLQEFVHAGGLITDATNESALRRRAATPALFPWSSRQSSSW